MQQISRLSPIRFHEPDTELDRLDGQLLLELRKSGAVEHYDLMRRFPDHSVGILHRRIERLLESGQMHHHMDGAYRMLKMPTVADDVTA